MRAAHFAGDDDAIGGRERLRGDADGVGVDARLRAFAEKLIDDFVRNTVANLVRMAFGNGLAGEQDNSSGSLPTLRNDLAGDGARA